MRYEQETGDAKKCARLYARSTICHGSSTSPFSFTITMKGMIKKYKSDKKDKIKRNIHCFRRSTGKEAPNEVLCRLAQYITLKDTLPSLATKFSEQ